ncbi:uncharacterized mitochondrial protein AtMg00810-like [Panicum virgatum]|uniref:uncharacterized mitochondrial protein AtMg00810-like n=1 Tax=Panicum virgatum TaxID=38727 RepID=UPI0019D5599D|nr:uncharacterized mitochondrial protein AtMg00810-like [Panicum virgatum]
MKATFQMSDLGLLHYYLGLEVTQLDSGITLGQSAYAAKILENAGLTGCNPSFIPMEPRLKLSKESTASAVDATAYRSIVGSLRYLVNTRPDLAYSVGYVSRFMEKPTTKHLAAVKRVLRYIAGTLDYGCFYTRKEKDTHLVGFSNSDLAGDIDTRKSTTGVIYFLGKNVITWHSQKKRSLLCPHGVWLARLLAELKGKEKGVVKINIDNQSTVQLSKNPVFHDRSKHIDTRFQFIRECIEEGRVCVASIGTTEQLADLMTKALARERFCDLRARLGLVNLKQICKA